MDVALWEGVPEIFWLGLTIFLGLCLGSFATALVYRLPRGISMVAKTRSACPSCQHDLAVRDLVPVFSWLMLKGRCRYCGVFVGWRYPLVEILTLGLCLCFYFVYGFTAIGLCLFVLAAVLAAIIGIDFAHKIIPDTLNITVGVLGLVGVLIAGLVSFNPPEFLLVKGAGALGGAALYGFSALFLRQVFLWVMNKEALGLGDVKFFAAVGVWFGLDAEMASWFMLLSGGFGIGLALFWKKMTGEAVFPFGPALVAAFVVVLCLWSPHFITI